MEKKKNGTASQSPTNVNAQLIGGFRIWSIRRLLAVTAASIAIIVANSNACLAGQQLEQNGQTETSVVVKTEQPANQTLNSKSDLSNYSLLIAAAVLLPATILLTYSLVTRGKTGTGWKAICITSVVATFLARVALSIFYEITSENSIQDWDS